MHSLQARTTGLGVSHGADDAELKKAFFGCHGSGTRTNPDHVAEAETVFKAVKYAYDVLSDPNKRRRYDSKLGVRTRAGR